MLRSIGVVAAHELFEMEEPPPILAIEGPDEQHGNGIEAEGDGNPVGILQELCMKLKYPPPTYDVKDILIRHLFDLARDKNSFVDFTDSKVWFNPLTLIHR